METNSADVLLRQYAECPDPEASEALLGKLVVEHAQPGIHRIVKYKLAFQGAREAQDIEDVASEVLVELIGRLRAMKAGAAAESIGAFSGYTAVAAYHACHEYLRRKYPNRHRLKTRLRYLLNTEKRFAIWEDQTAGWICGLSDWQTGRRAATSTDVVNRWREILSDLPHGRSSLAPAALLAKIFERFGCPVEFDELVSIVGQIWGVEDPPPAPEKAARELESAEADPAVRLELKQWMNELWAQIRDLPQSQRAALLLNLRCGAESSAAALLPLTGVATIREVAEVLGLVPEEFARLWNQLPLDDLAIAERLGISRQQVINLRKSARERLTRRMGGKYRLPSDSNKARGLPSI
jgi:RNA polymerase sigma factor (sigma-70 family)